MSHVYWRQWAGGEDGVEIPIATRLMHRYPGCPQAEPERGRQALVGPSPRSALP